MSFLTWNSLTHNSSWWRSSWSSSKNIFFQTDHFYTSFLLKILVFLCLSSSSSLYSFYMIPLNLYCSSSSSSLSCFGWLWFLSFHSLISLMIDPWWAVTSKDFTVAWSISIIMFMMTMIMFVFLNLDFPCWLSHVIGNFCYYFSPKSFGLALSCLLLFSIQFMLLVPS